MTIKNNKLVNVSMAAALMALTLFTKHSYSESLAVTELGEQHNMQGSQAQWLHTGHWLLASESQGLLLLEQYQQQITPLLAGNYEGLSLRQLSPQRYVLTSIDNSADAVVVWQLDYDGAQWQIGELSRLTPPQAQPEAACLYHDAQTRTVSVFVADVRGLISQTLVYDLEAAQPMQLPIRTFAGVSEASGCAVSDEAQQLFIGEAELGVWKINANSESRADKTPVALVSPFGQLAPEIAALSSDSEGYIYFTSSQRQQVYRYDPLRETLQNWHLEGPELGLEAIAVGANSQRQQQAVLFADKLDSYISTQLPSAKQVPARHAKGLQQVSASAETTPVAAFGDAADDPAIWIHPNNAQHSLILGTDKRRGLMVYGLDGQLRQQLAVGRVNNVDVRQHQGINNATHTLIAASNRSNNSISLFTVSTDGQVQQLSDIATNLTEIYGLCMYSAQSGHYVFVNDKNGTYQQYRIGVQNTEVHGQRVRQFSLPSQPEGCSADDQSGQLFMGEEDAGIWFIGAEPDAGTRAQRIQQLDSHLVADVEGMEIYHRDDGTRLLVVSSQGDNSYVLYRIEGTRLEPTLTRLVKFAVTADIEKGIDGVSETDGLTVTAHALPGYPQGVLVVQDGYNRMPQQPQNFKIIDWRQIDKLLP
ncbi:phytase [Pseudoalteromonas ruthenica]|uniref:phytase n=1 Tax=Pseudoalteromonas ruthenica TaxID=151081 RepID=UPI001246FC53|nr:phytase [Pseudoalteromonas ruthenica]